VTGLEEGNGIRGTFCFNSTLKFHIAEVFSVFFILLSFLCHSFFAYFFFYFPPLLHFYPFWHYIQYVWCVLICVHLAAVVCTACCSRKYQIT
jgi:hypothetical protein